MEWVPVGVFLFGTLLVLLLLGIPVAFCLLMVSLVGLVWMGGGLSLLADLPVKTRIPRTSEKNLRQSADDLTSVPG